MSITVEDYPATWEEEFVLSHQKPSFNNVPFLKSIHDTRNNLQMYYNEHHINFKVESDDETYIKIDAEKKIIIRQQDKNTYQIILSENEVENIKHIEISITDCLYVIQYINCGNERECRARYTLDVNVINELLGQVIYL